MLNNIALSAALLTNLSCARHCATNGAATCATPNVTRDPSISERLFRGRQAAGAAVKRTPPSVHVPQMSRERCLPPVVGTDIQPHCPSPAPRAHRCMPVLSPSDRPDGLCAPRDGTRHYVLRGFSRTKKQTLSWRARQQLPARSPEGEGEAGGVRSGVSRHCLARPHGDREGAKETGTLSNTEISVATNLAIGFGRGRSGETEHGSTGARTCFRATPRRWECRGQAPRRRSHMRSRAIRAEPSVTRNCCTGCQKRR